MLHEDGGRRFKNGTETFDSMALFAPDLTEWLGPDSSKSS